MEYTYLPLAKAVDYLLWDVDCCRRIPARYLINFQKGATLPFLLILMYYFQNFSLGAWMYTALHGSYGILWCVKDVWFGDA
jgi:hypothetical protein